MSVKTIRVELELDNGNFTSRLTQAGGAVTTFTRTVNGATNTVVSLEKHYTSLGSTIRDLTLTLSLARGAIQNVWDVTGGWMLGIIKTNGEIQKMTNLMKGLSNAGDDAARLKDATDTVTKLINMTAKVPFGLKALSDTFVKLKTTGIDPMNGSMKSLIDAVAAFGGSEDELHRAAVAIQQMGGKGVISMEELRQQLGEAVPRAVELMARSMNLSYAAMVKLISQGKVESTSALNDMFKEFDRTFGGRAQSMMQTWDGLVARLGAAWTLFQKKIGDTQAFNEALIAISGLVGAFNTVAADNFATFLGGALAKLITYTKTAVTALIQFRSTLILTGETLGVVFAVSKVAGFVTNFRAQLLSLSQGIVGLTTASGIMMLNQNASTLSWVRAGFAAASYRGVLATVTFGIQAVSVALATMGPLIGLGITALLMAADAWDLFGRKARDAMDALHNGKILDPQGIEDANRSISAMEDELERLKAKLKEIQDIQEKNPLAVFAGLDDPKAIQAKIDALTKTLHDDYAQLNTSIEENAKKSAETEVENRIAALQAGEAPIRAEYDRQMIEIAKDRQNKAKDEKTLNEEAMQERIKEQAAITQIYKLALAERTLALAKASDLDKRVISGEIIEIRKLLLQSMTEEAGLKTDPTVTLLGGTGGKTKIDKFAEAFKHLKDRIAELKAELAGLSGTGAKYAEMAKLGQLGPNVSPEKLASIVAAAQEVDKLAAALKKSQEITQAAETATAGLAKDYEGLAVRADELNQALLDPNLLQASNAYITLKKSEQEKIAAIEKLNDPEKLVQAQLQMNENLRLQQGNEAAEYAISLREKTRTLQVALMTEHDAKDAEYQHEVDIATKTANLDALTGAERVKAAQDLNDYLKALSEQHERDMEGPIEQLLRKWKDSNTAMQEASAGWLEDFADQWADFMMTGKFDFESFANSIIKDIIRIKTEALLADLLTTKTGKGLLGTVEGLLTDGLGSLLGGGSSSGSIGGTSSGVPQAARAGFHSGGIVGGTPTFMRMMNSSVFAGAPRFHKGGVIGSDEMPIIARKGEGVFTEEQMKRMGGGAANVQVNVINQSGQQVNAEQGQPRFDGKQMVLDVVLKAAGQPGPFRDAMRSAVR